MYHNNVTSTKHCTHSIIVQLSFCFFGVTGWVMQKKTLGDNCIAGQVPFLPSNNSNEALHITKNTKKKFALYGTDGRLFTADVSANYKVTWHKN